MGTKLLVFGFLYDMPDHCPAVNVLRVEQVVQSAWFLEALHGAPACLPARRRPIRRDEAGALTPSHAWHAGAGKAAHAVVVLAHMDADDPLVKVIHRAIRGERASERLMHSQYILL